MEEALKMRDADFQAIVESVFNLVRAAKTDVLASLPVWGENRAAELVGLDVLSQLFRDVFIWKVTSGSAQNLFFRDRSAEIERLAGKRHWRPLAWHGNKLQDPST